MSVYLRSLRKIDYNHLLSGVVYSQIKPGNVQKPWMTTKSLRDSLNFQTAYSPNIPVPVIHLNLTLKLFGVSFSATIWQESAWAHRPNVCDIRHAYICSNDNHFELSDIWMETHAYMLPCPDIPNSCWVVYV